jgi:hypothetical protein
MRSPAARAPAGCGEACPITKNILAFQALRRIDIESPSLRNEGALDMKEMVVDLLFPDSNGRRKVPSAMFLPRKQHYHLLPIRLHGKAVFNIVFHKEYLTLPLE